MPSSCKSEYSRWTTGRVWPEHVSGTDLAVVVGSGEGEGECDGGDCVIAKGRGGADKIAGRRSLLREGCECDGRW